MLLSRQQPQQPPFLHAIAALPAPLPTRPKPTQCQHRGYARKKQVDHEGEGGEFFLEQLQPNTTPRKTYTEEELKAREARVKEFSRNMMHFEIKLKTNLKRKKELMFAAFDALPEELKKAAGEPDMSYFPKERGMFTDTPPIAWYRQWKRRQQGKQR